MAVDSVPGICRSGRGGFATRPDTKQQQRRASKTRPDLRHPRVAMLTRARLLLELVRFSHTVFALPFALLSAALAWQDEPFRWPDLLGILLCMVFARTAAMAFNRLADRRLDAANPRTANRHLPAGLLSPLAVTVFTLVCAAGFVASTLLFIVTSGNWWPLWLSGPVLIFLCTYSYT